MTTPSLPLTLEPPAGAPTPTAPKKRLLLVDDERNVLKALTRMLRNQEYDIITASSGEEALAILATTPIQVVMSDQRMPEMTGTELLAKVRQQYPDTIRVVLSGYADVDSILGAINHGHIYQFQTKPWQEDKLKQVLEECFTHHDFMQQRKELAKALQEENRHLLCNTQYLLQFMVSRLQRSDLCQEVFEDFPLPVIGIDSAQRLFMLSDMTHLLFPSLYAADLMEHISDCLPHELLLTYETILNTPPIEPPIIAVDDLRLRVHAHRLCAQNSYLLLLEILT